MFTLIFKFVVLILGEWFAFQKRKREANEKFEADMKVFNELVQKSLDKMKEEARADSAQAKDVEDQVDQEINSK